MFFERVWTSQDSKGLIMFGSSIKNVGVVIIAAVFFIPNQSSAQTKKTKKPAQPTPEAKKAPEYFPRVLRAVVVDTTGERLAVSDPRLDTNDAFNKEHESGFLQVVIARDPRRDAWINIACIKQLSFAKAPSGKDLSCEVTLVDGEIVKGYLGNPALRLEGKSDAGDIKLALQDVKSIDHVGLGHTIGGKTVSIDGGRAMKGFQDWRAGKGSGEWKLVDGELNLNTTGVAIWNRYCSDRYSIYQSTGKWFDIARVLDLNWPLKKGATDIQAVFAEIEEFQLTGTSTDGRPNVTIKKIGGTKVAATLALPDRKNTKDCQIDEGDMLLWHVPYGYEGIPLLPNRAITIQRISK
jgi:hypothetical protein